MIFYGPAFRPGRHGEFARVVDMAPTLAWVTGTNPTERLDGHVLTSALRAVCAASRGTESSGSPACRGSAVGR